MARKRTITVDDNDRPHVAEGALLQGYRDMAADEAREREAAEWIDGVIGAPSAAPARSRSRREV